MTAHKWPTPWGMKVFQDRMTTSPHHSTRFSKVLQVKALSGCTYSLNIWKHTMGPSTSTLSTQTNYDSSITLVSSSMCRASTFSIRLAKLSFALVCSTYTPVCNSWHNRYNSYNHKVNVPFVEARQQAVNCFALQVAPRASKTTWELNHRAVIPKCHSK